MILSAFSRSFAFGGRPGPTGGDPLFSNVVSLLHFDNNYTDVIPGITWTPSSNPTFVSGMYGSPGAIRINPGNFVVPVSSDLLTGSYFGSKNFCIEASVIIGSTWTSDGRNRGVFGSWTTGNFAFGVRHYGGGSGDGGRFSIHVGTSILEHPTDLTKGEKYTVALTRNGNVYTLYVNGVPSDPLTKTGSLNFTNLGIGSPTGVTGLSGPLNGNIDEFRVTLNTPRYTGAYTPQTEPFPDT